MHEDPGECRLALFTLAKLAAKREAADALATPAPVWPRGKDPFHGTHTGSKVVAGDVVWNDTVVTLSNQEPCQWSNLTENESGEICPWYIRQLRNSMFRTFDGKDKRGDRD